MTNIIPQYYFKDSAKRDSRTREPHGDSSRYYPRDGKEPSTRVETINVVVTLRNKENPKSGLYLGSQYYTSLAASIFNFLNIKTAVDLAAKN